MGQSPMFPWRTYQPVPFGWALFTLHPLFEVAFPLGLSHCHSVPLGPSAFKLKFSPEQRLISSTSTPKSSTMKRAKGVTTSNSTVSRSEEHAPSSATQEYVWTSAYETASRINGLPMPIGSPSALYQINEQPGTFVVAVSKASVPRHTGGALSEIISGTGKTSIQTESGPRAQPSAVPFRWYQPV